MKVYMGPHINRWVCNIERDFMARKYGEKYWTMPQCDYDRMDRFMEKLDDAIQWVYNHTINLYLDRKERKIKVHIDDYDTWGMDYTLAHIVVPMLNQLKETKHGSPLVDNADVPEELRTDDDEDYDVLEPKWNYVIDEMIFAFESKLTDWEDQFFTKVGEVKSTPLDKDGNESDDFHATMYRMDNSGIEIDEEGYQAYQDRVTKGFTLFGRYYESLWD